MRIDDNTYVLSILFISSPYDGILLDPWHSCCWIARTRSVGSISYTELLYP